MKYTYKILLLLITIALVITLVACGKDCKKGHKDINGDGRCDECGVAIPNPDQCTEHNDSDGDGKCDKCGADMPNSDQCTEHSDSDGDEKCDECDAPIPATCTHTDDDNNARCDICDKSLIDPDKDTPEIEVSYADDGVTVS